LRSVFDDADIRVVIVANLASAAIVSQVCEDAKVWIGERAHRCPISCER
jgi:hypothetical protein